MSIWKFALIRGDLWTWADKTDRGVIQTRLSPSADASKGPVQLTDVNEGDGWFANLDDLSTVAPYADYVGERTSAAWLPNSYVAKVWKSFHQRLAPLSPLSPANSYKWGEGFSQKPSPHRFRFPEASSSWATSTPANARVGRSSRRLEGLGCQLRSPTGRSSRGGLRSRRAWQRATRSQLSEGNGVQLSLRDNVVVRAASLTHTGLWTLVRAGVVDLFE